MLDKHIRPYIFALRVVWKSSKNWTLARFILILLQAILPLVSLYLMKLIIDTVIAEGTSNPNTFDQVLPYMIYFGLALFLQTVANTSTQLVSDAQEQRVSDYMTEMVQTQALALDLSYFENPKFHNTYFQAQKEAVFRPIRVVNSLMNFLQNGISLVLLSGFLSFMHYGVALVLIISIIPAVIIRYHFSKKLYDWQKDRVAKERESHYLNMVIGDHLHAKEMRVFNAGAKLRSRFKAIRANLFREKLKIGKLRTRTTLIAKVFEIVAEVGVYIFIVYRTVNGLITIGDMVIYFQAFQKGKTNLTNALEALVQLMENRMFLSFIQDFMNFRPKLKQAQIPIPTPKNIKEGLELRGVSFSYPGQSKKALTNTSLVLKKGQLCAIVGKNGSGKSTLIKLLCRLYDPVEGEIMLDGQPIAHYSLKDYQGLLSVTFQDFAQYQLTVEENITLNYHENPDIERLKEVTRITGADEFIDKLPESFNQMLGRQFKQGQELSLGQWQKIAIARSMYRNADIIILDEPTSAIDPLAEDKIFKELKRISQEKIVILITHRLYNLKQADQIVVMDNGSIKEKGTHQELMALNGHYLRMLEKQTDHI